MSLGYRICVIRKLTILPVPACSYSGAALWESETMSACKQIVRLSAFFVLLIASVSASSDTRIVQVWSCTLKEGRSVEDLQSIHAKWKAWANKQSYGGGIEARIATPVVSAIIGVVN